MEWQIGSDDVSDVQLSKPRLLDSASDNRPPGRVFGVRGTPYVPRRRPSLEDDAAMLGAALVRAYEDVHDPARLGLKPLVRQYLLFLKANSEFTRKMASHFTALDTNSDGYIDDAELMLALEKGHLSQIGVRTVKTWDINFSKRISWQEFELGPLFLVILESNKQLLHQFIINAPGNADEVTKVFRSEMGPYVISHPAAVGLIQLEETVDSSKSALSGFLGAAREAMQAHAQVQASTQQQQQHRTIPSPPSHNKEHRQQTEADEQEEEEETDEQFGGDDEEEFGVQDEPDFEPKRVSLPSSHDSPALAETQSSIRSTAAVTAEARARAQTEAHLGALSVLGLGNEVKAEAADKARAAGIGDALKWAAGTAMGSSDVASNQLMAGFISGSSSSVKQKGRYKSKYGIPSFLDEMCVMCQYMVQRVEKELETKVVDDTPSIFEDRPYQAVTATTGGMPGLEQIAGRAGGARPDRVGLIDQRGQRSPTRMINGVASAIIRRVCGDRSPFLFRPICQRIWAKRYDLSYGIFRKLGPGGSCMETQLCGVGSYIFSSASVHLPLMSNKYNNGRGICGLLGGVNARAHDGVSETMCFAKQATEQIGLILTNPSTSRSESYP